VKTVALRDEKSPLAPRSHSSTFAHFVPFVVPPVFTRPPEVTDQGAKPASIDKAELPLNFPAHFIVPSSSVAHLSAIISP
jgi:hypothetical protein